MLKMKDLTWINSKLFVLQNSIMMQLKDRFVSLKNIAEDFNFLTGKAFQSFAMEDLESKAVLLSGK